eukprot:352149-Chlamydomonas_euryale.AAC.9
MQAYEGEQKASRNYSKAFAMGNAQAEVPQGLPLHELDVEQAKSAVSCTAFARLAHIVLLLPVSHHIRCSPSKLRVFEEPARGGMTDMVPPWGDCQRRLFSAANAALSVGRSCQPHCMRSWFQPTLLHGGRGDRRPRAIHIRTSLLSGLGPGASSLGSGASSPPGAWRWPQHTSAVRFLAYNVQQAVSHTPCGRFNDNNRAWRHLPIYSWRRGRCESLEVGRWAGGTLARCVTLRSRALRSVRCRHRGFRPCRCHARRVGCLTPLSPYPAPASSYRWVAAA